MADRLENSGKWGAYLEVSAEEVSLGESLTMSPVVFGAPQDAFTYNYVFYWRSPTVGFSVRLVQDN